MLIDSIDIREFRGISKCSKPLPLSKFTVLLGRNNSGKSSILEALSLFPDYESKKPYLEESMIKYISGLHGGFDSLIYGYSGNAEINCTVKDKTFNIKISDNNKISLNGVRLTSDEEVAVRRARMSPVVSPEKMSRDFLQKHLIEMLDLKPNGTVSDTLSNATFFIPNDTSFMDKLQAKLNNELFWNRIIKSGANTRVIRLVNKCVDDKYTEVLRTPELSARKERGKDNLPLYIKIKDLGDGIQKVVTTGLWLEAINPSLVLWDDFEGSAHPSLIKELLEWIAEKPWQVIMSTHSFDVLVSLLEVRPNDTQVIQLKKTEDDILVHNTLSLDELEDTIDTSQDPRKMVDLLGL
jgi:AAA15 family ATPase/GTPase